MNALFTFTSNSIQNQLFRYFFSHPNSKLYLREIGSLLKLDPANLSRELNKLERIGVFSSEKRGNQKHFSLNKENPIYPELKSIVSKTILDWPSLLREKRAAILRLADKFGAKRVRVFGSVARGEASSSSDLDLLVDMEKGRSLLDVIGFEQDTSELLGRKVDVVTDGGISPHLKDQIYREAKPL